MLRDSDPDYGSEKLLLKEYINRQKVNLLVAHQIAVKC